MPQLQSEPTLSSAASEVDALALASPRHEALRAVEAAAFSLAACRDSVPADPVKAFETLDRVDRSTQPHRLRLMRDYLSSGGRMQSYHQRRVVRAATEYAGELARSYTACLKLAGGEAPIAFVAMLAARAIRAHTLQLRWMLLHYAAPDALLWTRLHSLFAECEGLGLDGVRIRLYPAMTTESTVGCEYLRALAMAVSSVGTLLPQSQAVAERLIAALALHFVIRREPTEACHFVVDLRSAWSPQRRLDRTLAGEDLRFFGTGDAATRLREWSAYVAARGLLPKEAGLPGVEPNLAVEVMTHLERHWGAEPPRRQHERFSVLRTLHVARGFPAACLALGDRQTDPGQARTTETWTTEDESAGGFGAFLKMRDGDDFAVGDLVAAHTDRPGPWRIGVIRRLSTRENGYHSIGVQVLAFGALLVELLSTSGDPPFPGLLVPTRGSSAHGLTARRSEEILVVLGRGAPADTPCWRMRVQEQDYRLGNPRTIEAGGDFQAVRFEVSRAILDDPRAG
jgi:hypothetical protein